MELIATEGGRILDLVPIEEIRPISGLYFPDFIKDVTSRYAFGAGPPSLAEAAKSGAKFEHGKFDIGGTVEVIKELAIYTDGVICDCFNTRTADLILDDFFAWATETFKLRERQSPPHRTYTSVIVVEFANAVEAALGKLARIRKMLSKSMKNAYGWDYEFNLQRLAFAVDQTTIPQLRSTQFYIERKLGVPYSENRYYSMAPLKTEEHILLLAAIETELLASS
jgi:hypothetical protein